MASLEVEPTGLATAAPAPKPAPSALQDMQNTGDLMPTSSAADSSAPVSEKALEEGPPPILQSSSQANAEEPIPQTIFRPWEKRVLVFMVSLAGFFSPISANIYFPALNSISAEYRVSTALVNLTVTVYMLLQAFAPSITGPLSDNIGRRPVYAICFIIYIGANVGLALQHQYAALLVLRGVQSSGSSGTVALANAVVSDFATVGERGTYIGYASLGGVLGIAIGPIIGGIISDFLGWRFIFWFLVILASAVGLVMLLILPETARGIVGNGYVRPPKWQLSLWDFLPSARRRRASYHLPTSIKPRTQFINPLATLKICFDKEARIILLANGLVFAGYYAVATAIPSQFTEIYGYNDLKIGLSFIPIGVSSGISTIVVGRLTDWNYARHARRLGITVEEAKSKKTKELGDFPIETVRCQVALPILVIASLATIAYGWVLQARTSVAAPLVFLFFIGFCANGFLPSSASLLLIYILTPQLPPHRPTISCGAPLVLELRSL
ncbi:hypothetical protein CIB48_g2659 [Xylaria polymorpha]|nr:hypothetical protein CIB48_g2659 [Xylaria polymorpha]